MVADAATRDAEEIFCMGREPEDGNDVIMLKEMRMVVNEAFARLSWQQRMLVGLYVGVDGKKHHLSEIADRFWIPEYVAIWYINGGIKKIRDFVLAYEQSEWWPYDGMVCDAVIHSQCVFPKPASAKERPRSHTDGSEK